MEGTGNDFIIIDDNIDLTTEQIQLLSNRNYGIGCDQLIIMDRNSDSVNYIRIFNSNGSQAFSCGNGIRSVGLLMKILYKQDKAKIQVVGGNLTYTKIKTLYNDTSGLVYAGLGQYNLTQTNDGSIVEIGNKHLIIEIDKIENSDIAYAKHLSEKLDLNLSYVALSNSKVVALTYERGVGLTKACGSAAAAIHITRQKNKETVVCFSNSGETILAGGKKNIYIVADARLVFSGTFYL